MSRFQTKRKLEADQLNAFVRAGDYVARCEAGYRRRVENVTESILKSGCRIVMLAGPSSSGKTTSTHKIAGCLASHGVPSEVISLDNFYRSAGDGYPKNPDGTDDYESIHALDIPLVNRCLRELVETGRSSLPTFSFYTRESTHDAIDMELSDGEILLIEGIHALNPLLRQELPEGSVYKVYLGLRTEYCRDGERILPTRDLRIVRRMVRDVRERDRDAEGTLLQWPSILAGEEKWIRPFKKEADTLLNTSLDYEPCLFGPLLDEMHAKGLGGSQKETLDRLWREFRGFEELTPADIPADSMLREFVGKS